MTDTLQFERVLDTQVPSAGLIEDPVDVTDAAAEVDRLRRRLATQPVIEQSKGVVMGRFGVDAETAFAVLVGWSSRTNLKLRDVSRVVVATISNGDADPVGFIPPSLLGLIDSLGAEQRPSGSAAPLRDRNVLPGSPPVGAGSVADTEESISAELRDAVTDAVMGAAGRVGRADVICGLLGEGFGSVGWLAGEENADDEELASLGRLVAAAHDHHVRMAATGRVDSR